MSSTNKVVQGMQFHSGIADAMPLFIVTKYRGNGVWDCVVDANDIDYAGTTRVFDEKDILGRVNMGNVFKNLAQDHDSWWRSQSVGSVIHYHNGFDQFVRCEIIASDGEMKALPVALVGSWREYDLVKVDAFGEVHEGYHVRSIRAGEPFQPNFSNVYEASESLRNRCKENPSHLQVIDLSIPDLTAQQIRAKELNLVRLDVIALLNAVRSNDTDVNASLMAALSQAKEKLTGVC